MPSQTRPFLRLVWPPQEVEVEGVDCWSILEAALRNEGWRSVSFADLMTLPANTFASLKQVETPKGSTWWINDVRMPWSCSE